jgi:hypothetical protein
MGSMSQSSLPVSFLFWFDGRGRSGGAGAEDVRNRTGVVPVMGYTGLSGYEAADEGKVVGPAQDGTG